MWFSVFSGSTPPLNLSSGCHLWDRIIVKPMQFRHQVPHFHGPLPSPWEEPQWSSVCNFLFFFFKEGPCIISFRLYTTWIATELAICDILLFWFCVLVLETPPFPTWDSLCVLVAEAERENRNEWCCRIPAATWFSSLSG